MGKAHHGNSSAGLCLNVSKEQAHSDKTSPPLKGKQDVAIDNASALRGVSHQPPAPRPHISWAPGKRCRKPPGEFSGLCPSAQGARVSATWLTGSKKQQPKLPHLFPIEGKPFFLASRLSLQLLASPSSSLALCLQRKPSSSARFSLLPHSGHRYVEGDSREAGQHHPGTTQDLQTKLSPIRQKKLI